MPSTRAVLVHGVGLPRPDLFGTRLNENIRELGLHSEPTIIRVDWHAVTDKPDYDELFPFDKKHAAGLMRGIIGAAWRGHNIRWPLRLLELTLVISPLAVFASLVVVLHSLQSAILGRTLIATFFRLPAWLLLRSLAWPFPESVYRYAPVSLFGYGCTLAAVAGIVLFLCVLRAGLTNSVRIIILILLRPLVFCLSMVGRPAVVSFWIACVVFIGMGQLMSPSSPGLAVFPDAVLVVIPEATASLSSNEGAGMLWGYLLLFGAGVIAYLIARALGPPLKVVADVVRYMGDSEYAARLLSHLDQQIDPSRIDPGDHLVLVGHSLGSVILLDWLIASKDRLNPSVTIDLVTIGSPLRRFITRFFSSVVISPDAAAADLASHFEKFRWLNAYRPFDPIGTSLFRFQHGRSHDVSTRQSGKLWMRAHTGYWDDERVMEIIYTFLRTTNSASQGDSGVAESVRHQSDWHTADAGVEFLGRLSPIGPKTAAWLGALILTVLSMNTTYRLGLERENNANHELYRQRLEEIGITAHGWIYEFTRMESLASPEERVMFETTPHIIVFETEAGQYVAFEIDRSRYGNDHWRWELQHEPWARSYENARVREAGLIGSADLEAKRWPVTIRYLADSPSEFDIADFQITANSSSILQNVEHGGTIVLCVANGLILFPYFFWLIGSCGSIYCGYPEVKSSPPSRTRTF